MCGRAGMLNAASRLGFARQRGSMHVDGAVQRGAGCEGISLQGYEGGQDDWCGPKPMA